MRVPIFPVLIALATVSAAEPLNTTAPQEMTAQEYYAGAERLYSEGKHADAAALFGKFIEDFGKSKDAEAAIRGIRFRHAMCFVHLRKFAEAAEMIQTALQQSPPLAAPEIQELQFWLGVSQIQEKNYPEARADLEKFLAGFPEGGGKNPAASFPAASKIPEAKLMVGSAWILEGKFPEAARYYAGLKSSLPADSRSRAAVLELYALLESRQNEAAMNLVQEEFPRLGDFVQLITWQSLTLELGNRWLEAGEYRKAILCLQRVWPAERLLKHQQARIEELENRLQAAETKRDPCGKFVLGQMIQTVQQEIGNFQKLPSFDAALRLRLAMAYQGMNRSREAALILEDMLKKMPADKVVEQASANLVQTWFQVGRWPKVAESAAAFQKTFPNSSSAPLVLYLEGLAAQKDLRYEEATSRFDTLLGRHAGSEFAPRASFMKGFTLLLEEKYADAIRVFEKFEDSYPDHELAEAAAYWRGMGLSLDKKFAQAREAMSGYLKHYRDAPYAGSAAFRKAYCAQNMEDFTTSIRELRAFLRTYPGHEETAEARILLGDALMNEGQIEEGIAAFRGIPRKDVRLYEEGIFKTAKALKLTEEYGRLLDLMKAFQKECPQSPRIGEAVAQIGWIHRQANQPEKAREAYWEAIREHGASPAILSVDDLFPALAKLYKDDQTQYLSLLSNLQQDAKKKAQPVLVMRALWAQALALRKSDPARSQTLLLEAWKASDVQTSNPRLLADFAEALRVAGKPRESLQLFRDLIKWNPGALQKDRALAAIGFADLQEGREREALAIFSRLERESVGSVEIGRVLLAKAGIEERDGHTTTARKTLEFLLAAGASSGKEKAEALFRIGQIHMAGGKPGLAIPYFQRIYVMHARWRDWAAKAYLRSGEAFEKLQDTESARKSYEELAQNDELSDLPESHAARKRLEVLGASSPAQGGT